jgi:hypothetical protein
MNTICFTIAFIVSVSSLTSICLYHDYSQIEVAKYTRQTAEYIALTDRVANPLPPEIHQIKKRGK